MLAQCSTYKIKPDMNKSGVVNKTPKWYVDYKHETMFKYQEAATAVSPDMELAVKKATLLAKAKSFRASTFSCWEKRRICGVFFVLLKANFCGVCAWGVFFCVRTSISVIEIDNGISWRNYGKSTDQS